MSTADHNKDRAPQHSPANTTSGRAHDGDDRQLPGIGFRRDRPAVSPMQEQQETQARGQARFQLTGLGMVVPIAALTVPALRQQLLAARRENAADGRLNRLSEQGTMNLAARVPDQLSGRRSRLGPLPSLLLGALLGGGATLLYLSRKNTQQQRSGPQQAQQQHAESPAHIPISSGTIKEATVAMVSQAQEILGEVRDTIGEQSLSPTVECGDDQRPALSVVPETEAQPSGSIDETTSTQASPGAAPRDTDRRGDPAPAATPAISERQSEATQGSSLATPSASRDEASSTPQQQPTFTTPPTPSIVESTGKPAAATPRPTQTTAPAAAGVAAALQAQIKEHMSVLDSKGMRVGAVDRVEATGSIKLIKDGHGKHHWLPLRWVTRVDIHVHLSRTTQQVRREWKTSAPRAH